MNQKPSAASAARAVVGMLIDQVERCLNTKIDGISPLAIALVASSIFAPFALSRSGLSKN